MTRPIKVPLTTPKRIRASQFARNGMAPSAKLDSLLASQINFAVQNRQKMFFSQATPIDSLPAGVAGTKRRMRFRFMTGVGTTSIAFVIMAKNRAATASTTARIQLDLIDVVAASTVTEYASLPPIFTTTTTVDDISHVQHVMACDEKTVYELNVSDTNYSRLMGITGYGIAEAPSDESSNYLAAVSSFGKPILAARHNLMRDRINDLYAYSGPHLIAWSSHDDIDPAVTSAGSLVRAFSTGADFFLPLSKMARRAKSTVPVVFGAVGDLGGGSPSCDVFLYQGGSSVGSVRLTADDVWVTTTLNLAASDLAYDIRIQRVAGTTHTLKGVTCYVYDP